METPPNLPTDAPLLVPNLSSEDGDIDPRTKILESAYEVDRWNPVPGSSGMQHTDVPLPDEYQDGRTLGAELVSEGVTEAEHEQMDLAKDEEPSN